LLLKKYLFNVLKESLEVAKTYSLAGLAVLERSAPNHAAVAWNRPKAKDKRHIINLFHNSLILLIIFNKLAR
jgi:hypothetical protein